MRRLARSRFLKFWGPGLVLVAGLIGVAGWQISVALWRVDPGNPPATVYWHTCPYANVGMYESFESATTFERGALAYRELSLKQVGSYGGIGIYTLPLEADGCNGPWFLHLKVGSDSYLRYQRPGGP